MNKKLLGWLAAVGVLFTTACSTDETAAVSNPYTSGEEVIVSFNVSAEGGTTVRRAYGDGSTADPNDPGVYYPDEAAGEFPQISDGSKAHRLIYAVYDNEYNLLDQYGVQEATNELGFGQTSMDVTTFPTEKISLRLMRGQTYHIAFWAQNADCKAYDTKDLESVKVNYAQAKNNDELRDAFCATETFTVSADEERTVILRRPLAQINVGTAGYDYEAAVAGDFPNYLYSKIEVKGVATEMDVVRNTVKNENLSTATFGYARIPAYINYGEDDSELDGFFPTAQIPTPDTDYAKYQEQFLRVKLYANDGYLGYKGWADTNAGGTEPDTETFKYLSMCYVLVPAVTNNTDAYASVLESVDVYVASNDQGTDALHIGTDSSNPTVINVPAKRNWRTNIFGKNLLTDNHEVKVHVNPLYDGEYNYDDNTGNWTERNY